MLSRFHLIPERHGQTDRQTDRQSCYINIVSVLMRDKTCAVVCTAEHEATRGLSATAEFLVCDASKRMKPLRCQLLKVIYIGLTIFYARDLLHSHRPTMKVGDHTTLQSKIVVCF